MPFCVNPVAAPPDPRVWMPSNRVYKNRKSPCSQHKGSAALLGPSRVAPHGRLRNLGVPEAVPCTLRGRSGASESAIGLPAS